MSFPANFPEVSRRNFDANLLDLFTCALGVVHTYNSATSKADVELGTNRPLATAKGSLVAETLAICPDVPVLWPNSGGYSQTAPVDKGDMVLVLFMQLDPSNFLATGKTSKPLQSRTHSQSYAVCIPLGRPDTNPLQGTAEDAYTISGPEIRLGSPLAADVLKAAVGPVVKDAFEDIITWLKAHTHPTPSGTSSVSSPTTILDSINLDLESPSVYVEAP